MYANVCDSRRNIHPWPAHSRCLDMAVRKIPTAHREGPGCLGGGGGCRGGGGAAASLLCAVYFFLLLSVLSKSSMREEEWPRAPAMLLHARRPPFSSSKSPFALSPILALFLEHLIGDAQPPLCQALGACLVLLVLYAMQRWWEADG